MLSMKFMVWTVSGNVAFLDGERRGDRVALVMDWLTEPTEEDEVEVMRLLERHCIGPVDSIPMLPGDTLANSPRVQSFLGEVSN